MRPNLFYGQLLVKVWFLRFNPFKGIFTCLWIRTDKVISALIGPFFLGHLFHFGITTSTLWWRSLEFCAEPTLKRWGTGRDEGLWASEEIAPGVRSRLGNSSLHFWLPTWTGWGDWLVTPLKITLTLGADRLWASKELPPSVWPNLTHHPQNFWDSALAYWGLLG